MACVGSIWVWEVCIDSMSDMNFAKRKPDKKFWALVKERDLLEKERDILNVKIEKIQDSIDKQYLKMDFEVKK